MGASAVSGTAAATSEQDFIPADMAELAEHYYGFILRMVRKAGVPDQDAADSAQYIIERLARTGAVAQFDPGHVTVHQGRPVRTRFSTFLGAKVLLYCRGERGRLARRSGHELQILDASAEDGTSLAGLIGAPAAWDDYSRLEAQDFIGQMRARLAAVPPRSVQDTCDLVALFDELVAETAETGGISCAGIQKRFGISGTTAGAWLSRLKVVLKQAMDRPPAGRPPVIIGGVSLTAFEVAQALKILRKAKGIMVAQPLAKAGHPLAQAEKGWYHPFSREEIRKFPALAIEPGSHRKPAGHVKEAVIHRLERILESARVPDAPAALPPAPPAPCPAPDPDPASPEDEFEAALWRYISDAGEMDRLKALARRAYAEVSGL